MKWFEYKQEWHEEKIQKIKDGLLHQTKAFVLFVWVAAASVYVSTLWLYKAIREVSKEVKKK
jgi:hypothetical protein